MFSRQTEFPTEPNAITRLRTELLRAGRSILDLSGSNPTTVGLEFEPNWLRTLAGEAALRYEPDPFGMLMARRALAERAARLGYAQDPDRIVLSASTSEAYSHLFKLLCDPGDEVLIPQPSYPLFEQLAQLEHVKLVPYRLEYDTSWYIDLDSLRSAQSSHTKAVILVSPNNPTGSITRPEEFRLVAELGLPVISDEVFARFLFGSAGSRFQTASVIPDSLVFVLDGLSKSLGLPQCKLAWTSISGPARLVEPAIGRLEVIADAFLSVSTSIQCALPSLLQLEEARRGVILTRLEENLRVLDRLTENSCVTRLRLDGGWSAVLRLPHTKTETEWVLTLLEADGLSVQPGWFFDFASEAYVVVSLLTPLPDFADGIERLVRRASE